MSPYISLRNTNTEQKVCTDKKCYYRVKRLAYSLFLYLQRYIWFKIVADMFTGDVQSKSTLRKLVI